MRRRNAIRHPFRSAQHLVARRVVRSCLRLARRTALRRVIPYDGPSIGAICRVFNAYIRFMEAEEKKSNPPSRFKTLGTEEERERQWREDLERGYGEKAVAARKAAAREQAASRPRSPVPSVPSPQPTSPSSVPKPKCDVTAVPLVRLPNGMWGLDWSKTRPA